MKRDTEFLLWCIWACKGAYLNIYRWMLYIPNSCHWNIWCHRFNDVSFVFQCFLCASFFFCFARVFVHLKDFVHFKLLSTFEYEKQYHEPKLQINNLLSFIFNDKRRRVKKVKIIVCALHAYFAHARWHFLLSPIQDLARPISMVFYGFFLIDFSRLYLSGGH